MAAGLRASMRYRGSFEPIRHFKRTRMIELPQVMPADEGLVRQPF